MAMSAEQATPPRRTSAGEGVSDKSVADGAVVFRVEGSFGAGVVSGAAGNSVVSGKGEGAFEAFCVARRIPPSNNHALGETANAIAVTQPDTIDIRRTETRRAKTPVKKAIAVQSAASGTKIAPMVKIPNIPKIHPKTAATTAICLESGYPMPATVNSNNRN
jgi:hypothetical protein